MNTSIKPTNQRIASLRKLLKSQNLDAVIVPSADPHMSEYLPKFYQGRAWLSGFTGSVGTLVVGADFAHLWADSRYWLQADDELCGTDITLKKIGHEPIGYEQTILAYLPNHATIGIDSAVLSVQAYENLTEQFATKQIAFKFIDVLGYLWVDRDSLPSEPIYAHNEKFVSQSTADKLAKVRDEIDKHGGEYHLISSLDDIAWLTNLRGADVECNPVFLSHMLISQNTATLYTHDTLTDTAKAILDNANIALKPYDDIHQDLAKVTGSIVFDPAKVAVAVADNIADSVKKIHLTNPSSLLKAVKSDQDLQNIKNAMIQDGVALCEFFCEFEQRLANGETLSELDVDTMLIQKRSQQAHFVGVSFETIAGFNGNGAIVHYRAKPSSFSQIKGDGLLLIDSGGQYQNGTTDITRMVGIGDVPDDAKTDVTYVLKAHIALATAVFPVGVSSVVLDSIARTPLWQVHRNYGHGTGHGVGYFLNVHEGPQVIAYSTPTDTNRVIKIGMVTSNEPGLYRKDKWGIRIENLVACVPSQSNEFGDFACFEDLTLCPIDTRIIKPELLSDFEKTWLNNYHKTVYDKLIDKVSDNAKAWLSERTQAI